MKHFTIRNLRTAQSRSLRGLPAILLPMLVCASLLLALAGPPAPVAAAGVLYVDRSSSCTTTCGGSWADAYPHLQDALAVAVSGDQLWVAEGVYYPDEGTGQTDNDVLSIFTIQTGVAVYGGFAGTETQLTQRNPALHLTILSGDLQQDDLNSDGNFIDENYLDIRNDNALHVVQLSNTDQTTFLDGFVITAGNANGANPAPNAGLGGGVLALNASPVLENLIISGNNATNSGGGLYSGPTPGSTVIVATPVLSDTTFIGNLAYNGGGMLLDHSGTTFLSDVTFEENAAEFGGGLYLKMSYPYLMNVTFSANTAGQDGGGIYNTDSSSPSLYNATLSGNSATGSGGGMYNNNSSPALVNTIIANSVSGGDCVNDASSNLSDAYHNLIEDSANACGIADKVNGNIIGADPKLGPLADNGGFTPTFALLPESPAIDAGIYFTFIPSSDQRGASRPQDGNRDGVAVYDIGAYEVGGIVYVDQNSACTSDCGTSWATAFPKLQDGLAAVLKGGQVWVAEGVYYPDEGAGQTDDDVLSIFTVIQGVSVYGGFAGNETALDQRNPSLHATILSGDLQQDDMNTDGNFIAETYLDIRNNNALHVVQISNTDKTTVLDGVIVTAGNANGANPAANAGIGGGVLALNASPMLVHLVLSGNNATNSGGGLYSGPIPGSGNQLAPAPVLSEMYIHRQPGRLWRRDAHRQQHSDPPREHHLPGQCRRLRRRVICKTERPDPHQPDIWRQFCQP